MANPYHLVVARKGRNVAVVYCGPSEVDAMAAAIKVPASKASEVDVFLSPAPSKILKPKPAKKAAPKKADPPAPEPAPESEPAPEAEPPKDILDGE